MSMHPWTLTFICAQAIYIMKSCSAAVCNRHASQDNGEVIVIFVWHHRVPEALVATMTVGWHVGGT